VTSWLKLVEVFQDMAANLEVEVRTTSEREH
jgi:hypothetical protein